MFLVAESVWQEMASFSLLYILDFFLNSIIHCNCDFCEHLSHVMRKPVFGSCDQVRLKPACPATDTSYGLEISAIAT